MVLTELHGDATEEDIRAKAGVQIAPSPELWNALSGTNSPADL
jgi:hypothetical protein